VTRGRLPAQVVVMTFLFLSAVYFVLPVYWVLVSSTKSTTDLFGSFGLWFAHFRLGPNLSQLFTANQGIFTRWLLNSVLYAGVGAAAATVLSAAAGYALAKYRFRGREAAFTVILAGVMVPPTALALPLYLMMSRVGLANSYLSVLLPSMVSPFGAYLARVYAASAVPDELIEAARLDGAGEVRIFSRVAAPVMTPALVTIGLFTFVGIWNNFFLPLVMLSNQNLYPITLGLTVWEGQTYRDPAFYQLTVTGAAVSAVLLVAAVVSLQRYWRGGLTTGALR
jgi:multiple sugar transport system permease protein